MGFSRIKDILEKLQKLAKESMFEGEKLAAQKAYDRIFEKYKDKEKISDWDLTTNEIALLAKYNIKVFDDGLSADVPRDDIKAQEVALTYLLKNALRKYHKEKPKQLEGEVKNGI